MSEVGRNHDANNGCSPSLCSCREVAEASGGFAALRGTGHHKRILLFRILFLYSCTPKSGHGIGRRSGLQAARAFPRVLGSLTMSDASLLPPRAVAKVERYAADQKSWFDDFAKACVQHVVKITQGGVDAESVECRL